MFTSQHRFGDVIVSIYHLNKGEGVPRHAHPDSHTTAVSKGRSRVLIEGREPFEMVPGDSDCMLPPSLHHEIRALEDGTVVAHISRKGNTSDTPPRRRVLMHDGTYQYVDE